MFVSPESSPGRNFYPRPPRGGRPATALHRGKAAVFLSTPSARRATFWRFRNGLCDEISIHALREEGDAVGKDLYLCAFKFLSTPSARRATYKRTELEPSMDISIHALREEGDREGQRTQNTVGLISIHALREEGDAGWRYGCSPADISIHALREEGDICRFGASSERPISIHALREEGDHGDATAARHLDISIHALREEGDGYLTERNPQKRNFYPRPPRGGRRTALRASSGYSIFLSTPSARRAT